MRQLYTCIFRLILLVLFLASVNPVFGQEEEEISAEAKQKDALQDSIQLAYKRNPFGIQVGIDLLKLGSFVLDFETKYEGQAGFSYKNLTLIVEGGYGFYASELAYKNATSYEVTGTYYRAGFDYALNITGNSQLLLGIRYALSTYEDKGTFEVESKLWNNYQETVERYGADANWGELILGTQTTIAKNLHFGWYFRWRKMLEKTTYRPIDIYNIPGYGKSIDNSVPALNLFLKYKLSF